MKKIATHNGAFQADDVSSVATLCLLGLVASLIRTRDPKLLAEADVRVDIGYKNNPETGDYDHHQPEGAGVRENGFPYAAFGLIWRKFGVLLCGSKNVADKVDKQLVQVVDARDVGYEFFNLKYGPAPYTVSDVIGAMNPTWQEDGDYDKAFMQAVEVAKSVILRAIERAKAEVEAETILPEALANRVDERLLVVDVPNCPWENFIVENSPEVLLVVVYSSSDATWYLWGVRKVLGQFERRIDLPAAWAGKRNEDLVAEIGIEDAIFCHRQRFIAGAKSRAGVLRMAKLALAE